MATRRQLLVFQHSQSPDTVDRARKLTCAARKRLKRKDFRKPTKIIMAVSEAEASNTVRNALIESLTAILSPQQEIRQQGEEQLKLLEVTEG